MKHLMILLAGMMFLVAAVLFTRGLIGSDNAFSAVVPQAGGILFVGNGPGGEAPAFDQVDNAASQGQAVPVIDASIPAGNGERVTVPAGCNFTGCSFTVTLAANPINDVNTSGGAGDVDLIGADLFTPMADRNGNGSITALDIERVFIVGSLVQAGDLNVSVFNVDRGLLSFTANSGDNAGEVFEIRYATVVEVVPPTPTPTPPPGTTPNLYVGNGPGGEAPDFDQVDNAASQGQAVPIIDASIPAGNGERITVPAGCNFTGCSFTVVLAANPIDDVDTTGGAGDVDLIGVDLFTPLTDRNVNISSVQSPRPTLSWSLLLGLRSRPAT